MNKAYDVIIAGAGPNAKDNLGIAALLVRPDGVVAWAFIVNNPESRFSKESAE